MFKKARFYPVIAGIYDFYFLSFLLGAIFALPSAFLKVAINPVVALSILPIGIILVVVYYSFVALRIRWFSPGELLTGRKIGLESKEWGNPFGYNRWALFLITLVTLAITSNTWDSLGTGHIYSFGEIAQRVIFLSLLSYGVVNVGRGQIGAVWLVVAYFGFYAWQMWNAPLDPIPQNAVQTLAITFLVIAALHFIIALLYGFLRSRNAQSLPELG